MNRAKIEDALLAMGIPANIKGFIYIAEAIQIMDANPNVKITKDIYFAIAKKDKNTSAGVERAIRHAFGVARSKKDNSEIVEQYIGFINCANFSSLARLYRRLKLECKEHDIEKQKEDVKSNLMIMESEIRAIVRQEFKMVLKEFVNRPREEDLYGL